MPKYLTCDYCGAPDAQEDYDGENLCLYHSQKQELSYLLQAYQEKRHWLHTTFIADLREMRKRIRYLRAAIQEDKDERMIVRRP